MNEQDTLALTTALRTTVLPLADARTLPGAVYHAEDVYAREQRGLFAKHWIAVAREDDLAEAGDFVTHETAGERLLVVRGDDGKLRAFFNVCRHRGARLVDEPQGRLRGAIACPYHAWTYALDGSFRRAPRAHQPAGTIALALASLPLATWAGFVLVNLDIDAPAFSPGDLPDLARFRLERLKRVRRLDYELQANWKIVCENYSECYHCPLVHPQLHRIADITSGGFEAGLRYNGGPMQLRDGFTTLSMSGTRRGPALSAAGAADDRNVYYYLVYPNLMLGIHPDYLLVHTVWPRSAARSAVRCEIYFAPQAVADPVFDGADTIEFWDLTNRQDWALCERVHQGSASAGYRPGPYHPTERCVHGFDRWYAEWLAAQLGR